MEGRRAAKTLRGVLPPYAKAKGNIMKWTVPIVISLLCAACSSMGGDAASAQARADRNRCEALRSYQPFYPGECAETTGGALHRTR